MRRFLSIVLMLVFALPLVSPALGQTAQPRLLLCCRKGGAHHCILTSSDGSSNPMLREHCPATSNPAVTGHASDWFTAGGEAGSASARIVALRIRQAEAGYRISFYRSRQKRGPPAFVLA